jgi:pimeloyl-ACP methyl ester carboxylesterase
MKVMNALPVALSAKIAYRLWGSLGRPEPVHERDRAVHERAVRGELEVHGKRVVTYRWGTGPRVILLVHGWRSRASRLSALVEALEGPDATVLAFDAPGNGASTGRRTTVLDYAEAIHQLGEQYGQFQAVVGHSFGVLATFLAVREGAAARRVVGISGMHSADRLVREFSRQLGISPAAERRLREKIGRRTFIIVDAPWERFVSRLDDGSIPLLLVHDSGDRVVPAGELDLIAADHPGLVELLRTTGLGHSRILSDPAVPATVADFVSASVRQTRSSAS